jgi:ATP/maltotriose-dependent transcriptional regulator MalT
MKLFLTLFLVFSSVYSSTQINKDSLLNFLPDGSKDSAVHMEALVNVQETTGLKSDDKQGYKNKLAELRLNFEKEIKDSQNQTRNLLFLFFVILTLAIFAIWFYFRKREKKHLDERKKLLQQIEDLKKKLSAQSFATSKKDRKSFSLDKEKIEKAINNRLGESSWKILNLIFETPSISNKEIAEKVSLSVEGVSSSLRRMYQAFEINSSSNKKITLIMKATRLSFSD